MAHKDSSKVRLPAVAGLFYPADGAELGTMVDALVDAAPAVTQRPKALIVPHAGYIYSGAIAASGYSALAGLRAAVRRVLLLGPAHRVYIRGLGAPTVDAFETPLGRVPLDRAALERLVERFGFVHWSDAAHAGEHSLEVHLPFLQAGLDHFELVPLVVGEAGYEQVETVVEDAWGGDETLVVVSSDLTHYLDYDSARRIDRHTADAIEQLAPERIGEDHACGRIPIGGLLRAACRHGLTVDTLDLRSSGDTAGPRNQVVGYGAWILHS
jgi:hypothetical protein